MKSFEKWAKKFCASKERLAKEVFEASKEYTDNKGLSEDLMKQCRLGWKAATRVACDLTSHQQVRVKKVESLLKKLKESIKRAEEVSVHS